MRIGGLATGMDIDMLVEKLMKAERMPLDRMEQDKTTLTWKRDAFREINKALFELENMTLEMEYGSTYNSKSVSSSNEGAVTATATSAASNGSYKIEVTGLATSAINVSSSVIDFDTTKTFEELGKYTTPTSFKFYTYDENGAQVPHNVKVNPDDTLNDVLKRISEEDNNVRAFYDENLDKVIMETTRTGNYNESGPEIVFDSTENSFFTGELNLVSANETGGTDATFIYNGMTTEMTSHSNSYTLNNVNFEFKAEGTANLNVTNDVEASFEKIMEFVDKYNQVVDKLNEAQNEEKYRDYKPLTDKQKEEMSEDEIKLWEEKAKSGILSDESVIRDGLYSLRSSWYESVDTGAIVDIEGNVAELTSITQIGITTTKDFMNGGKLKVDEGKLKEALREDPQAVFKLFSNDVEGASRGIVNRLEDTLEETMNKIETRAGKGEDTLENYTLGKRMKDLNERIDAFEDRLLRVENRYWSQFTAMEKAIQRMNQQSSYLMQQFG